MKLTKKQEKYILGGAGLLLFVLAAFLVGRMIGRKSPEERKVNVKVKIADKDGKTIIYDPTELIERLNKGLTTTYFWNLSERCDPLEELYNLDAPRFISAIKAYKERYKESIVVHMNACYRSCFLEGGQMDSFYAIKQRINNLKDLIQ